MKISAVAFTAAGDELAKRLVSGLCERGHEISRVLGMHGDEKRESLSDWARAAFARDEGIIFIGACGIAVRAIAPYLRDKRSDPAVVVIDERGRFAISLLSGHIGGANYLAALTAEILGATPVITTATDINGAFAVDMWAKRQGLILRDADIARDISAAILKNAFVGVYSDFPLIGTPPRGVTPAKSGELGICITYDDGKRPFSRTLVAIPHRLALGLGCRRGTSVQELDAAVAMALEGCKISFRAVAQVASIDLKADEPGLLGFCEKYSRPLKCFSAGELAKVEGEFSASEFVRGVTGIDNVCERAAVAALEGNGKLIIKKQARDGVTVSVAAPDFDITYDF